MRRTVIAAIVAIVGAVALATSSAPASAATNGMLAAVSDGRLVTVNPDGSGLRTLWAPGGGALSGLTWSPDGNRLALSYADHIVVYDVAKPGVTLLDNAGFRDLNPSWTAGGAKLTFRRIKSATEQVAVIANP